MATLDEARRAKDAVVSLLEHHETVNGVGIAAVESGYAVKVNLSALEPELRLPSTIDGVPITWELVGEVRKQ